VLATAYWATSGQGWCYLTGCCACNSAYLTSVIRYRQSIKPPPPKKLHRRTQACHAKRVTLTLVFGLTAENKRKTSPPTQASGKRVRSNTLVLLPCAAISWLLTLC